MDGKSKLKINPAHNYCRGEHVESRTLNRREVR
jgi:hypothetical protein